MKFKHGFFCVVVFLSTANFLAAEEQRTTRNPKAPTDQLLPDWIKLHLQLVRSTKGLSQVHIGRNFTYASIAFYESIVHGFPKYKTLSGQLQDLAILLPPPTTANFCWAASANAAMASALRSFYGASPQSVRKIDSLEMHYASSFTNEGFSREKIRAATSYGRSVATSILEWAKTDGSTVKHPAYEIPKGDGLWEPTPPSNAAPAGPFLSKNRTCIKGSVDNTLPPPPLKFSADQGSDFYKMVRELTDASQHLTEDQRAMGLFWDDFPDGKYYGALGHWASILRQVIEEKNITLIKGAEAFAKMSTAFSDAMNACWKAKYTYNVLRPVTYVNRYMNQPDWKPLIVTPSHPEYPAAHASVSMAAATALSESLGGSISFTDHSYDDLGFKARTFKNFEEAGKEAGLSRFYGGIHYKPSIEAGYILGKKVATNVLQGLKFQ